MPMTQDEAKSRARRLLEHRFRRLPNPAPPGPERLADMDAAYAIQDAADAILRAEHGYKPIGWKIAGTNPASRAHLKIDSPFYGRLYDKMAAASPARIAHVPDFHRVHEPEIAVEIGADLDRSLAPFDAARIEAATCAVRPAIEIIGTHFSPWTEAGAPNLASDNAAFGFWIVGSPVADWSRLDLFDGPVSISVDGEMRAAGAGRNVDGGPFGAAAWLANALAGRGLSLRAGDLITTGSVTAPVPVEPGRRVAADFGALGQVVLEI